MPDNQAPGTDNKPFLGTFLANGLWIYIVMVVGRVLGLIYLHNEERLGWFTDV